MDINSPEVTTKEQSDAQARGNFLFAVSYLCAKHGIDYRNDVDVDYKNLTINIKTKLDGRRITAFLSELQATTGQLE
jgi:hypothetical protein